MTNQLGFALRQVARSIVDGPHSPGRGTQSHHVSDASASSAVNGQGFQQTTRLVLGVITDVLAPAHCYRVALEKLGAMIPCTYAPRTGHGAYGARELNTLQPGMMVVVLRHPHVDHGYILCTIPPPLINPASGAADMISQSSRQRVDQAHLQPLLMPDSGRVVNWLANRPLDSTMVGEWGAITENGLRIFLDPDMIQLAVDELCGIYAFYRDQLLRVAGYNLQLWTACSERESLHDEGEGFDYQGYTPYPWEQTGLYAPNGDPHTANDSLTWQKQKPWYSVWEPADDAAQPWHRVQRFHAYLGQGGKQLVIAGPDSPAGPLNTYQTPAEADAVPPDFRGLFDFSVGLDGRAMMQSAKGISIRKRLPICAPRKLLRPEEPSGDNSTNYLFAGLSGAGNGPPHKITGGPDPAGTGNDQLQRAAGVLDLHAYLFNYAGIHPFFYHAKDWDLPDEQTLDYLEGNQPNQYPTFSDLAQNQFADAPPVITFSNIDHRYGEQNYFPNSCGIDWLEDGGMVISDGFGASIVSTGGSLFISAPGDIWLQSGRNIVQWAGDDQIIRAQNSIDLTASNKDVRIKAEQHFHALAGSDGGTGSILLESRGTSEGYDFSTVTGEDVEASGIILRTPHSDLVTWCRNVYVRTGGGGGQFGIDPGGNIVLDANQGQTEVIVNAAASTFFLRDSAYFVYGQDESKVHELGNGSVTFNGVAVIGGSAIIDGELVTNGSIFIADGNIAASQAQDTDGLVATLEGQDLVQVRSAIAQVENRTDNELPQLVQQIYTNALENQFYGDGQAGSDAVINAAEFSLRSVAQYGTENFSLYEALWQQIARIRGDGLPPWTELPVACQADPETYPYPGRQNFQSNAFYQQNLNLFSPTDGASVSRGQDGQLAEAYASPAYAEAQQASLQTYPVIRGPE